jgi:PAS domain S-box-containing protein
LSTSFKCFHAAGGFTLTRSESLTGSLPDRSDIDRFSLALQTSRDLADLEYSDKQVLKSRDQLIAALEELGVAEEEMRAQHEALVEAHRLLEIERHKYQALFDAAPDPFVVTDVTGAILQVNDAAAQLLGLQGDMLRNKPLVSFVEPEGRRGFRGHFSTLVAEGHLHKWVMEIKGRHGRNVPVEASVASLPSGDSRKTLFCWVLRDVSSRRETEESMEALNRALNARVAQRTRELELALEGEQIARREAEAANRIKSELFARLSHEFRTPLHAVSGYLEILQQNIHGGLTNDQRQDVDRIHQAQEHLLNLVNMILDFAKIEGGPIELTMAEIPIDETLRAAESLVALQFAKKNISYTHRGSDPRLTVFADREKLQQIVVNLLANAMKFTAPGGSVETEWAVEDETLLVKIRDTGSGIPADKIDEIFEPFVQLRAPGTMPAGGTGLGLAISRDLARAMGGDVRVASAVGVGSVFTLALPLRKRASGGKLSGS